MMFYSSSICNAFVAHFDLIGTPGFGTPSCNLVQRHEQYYLAQAAAASCNVEFAKLKAQIAKL